MIKQDKKYISILARSPLFRGISEEKCAEICEEIGTIVANYSREENIIREGDIQDMLYFVLSGNVRGEKFHLEGNVHLVNMYERGEFIGCDTVSTKSRIAPVTLISDAESKLLAFPIDRLMRCSRKEAISENMIHILADENIKKTYKIEIISKPGLRERILTFLRIRSQKLGRNSFHTMMTQEQLAQFLCVNRSALSHELNKMRNEQIIDFKRDWFEILEK